MAIITLEDLEGQIDGTIFAENLEDIVKRHIQAACNPRKDDQIVFAFRLEENEIGQQPS